MNKSSQHGMDRRSFLKKSSAASLAGMGGLYAINDLELVKPQKNMKFQIARVSSDFEREALYPYRFKGGAITECWQTMAMLENANGIRKIGLATQGILWSDAKVFFGHSESAGNALMYAMSERALQMINGQQFSNPVEMVDSVLPELLEYGKKITGNPELRKTFGLNALVGVDNAAWLLYAAENNITDFDDMIPAEYKPGLSAKHDKVASIPSFSAGTSVEKVKKAADEGFFMLKLKIGSAGTQKEMLKQDIEFLEGVHKAIGKYETPYTQDGKIPYYFDANGRYEEKASLERFLDHAKKIGAFDQIAVIEEPFSEFNETYVGDLGVRVAADESAHTREDAGNRIEQGYQAIAVKAIAKTLSETMKITQLAYEKNVPCFCADLTVNPILVEWNKNVAARLPAFPGMKLGLQETNGHQYYKQWDRMMTYHPRKDAPWVVTKDGVYETGKPFFDEDGGIFQDSKHYQEVFKEI
ncbi:MAG: L-alanine-DL-glutamate epimerase [Cyclobacteriaceae bacterium]|nr:L-alanine-DL-glutamate epimerase [Cyclobacteriaceae bacterium SS2]